jgi:hypothetical protein
METDVMTKSTEQTSGADRVNEYIVALNQRDRAARTKVLDSVPHRVVQVLEPEFTRLFVYAMVLVYSFTTMWTMFVHQQGGNEDGRRAGVAVYQAFAQVCRSLGLDPLALIERVAINAYETIKADQQYYETGLPNPELLESFRMFFELQPEMMEHVLVVYQDFGPLERYGLDNASPHTLARRGDSDG